MNKKGRSLFIAGILMGIISNLSVEAAGFIYDFNSRTVQGNNIQGTNSANPGAFDYSVIGSGSAGSLEVSQHTIQEATLMSGTFTSRVHAITVDCESVEQNDFWVNFRVQQNTPFRFSGMTTHRLQRNGNPLEESCGGPVAYLFGMTDFEPYIQTFIAFPFDITASGSVSSSFDVFGVFRANATHALYIALPAGAKIGAGGIGSVDSMRTLHFTLILFEPPALSVSSTIAGITLSWPTNDAGYLLESASSSAPPLTWSAVTNSVGLVGGKNSVNIGPGGTNRFYRLRKT